MKTSVLFFVMCMSCPIQWYVFTVPVILFVLCKKHEKKNGRSLYCCSRVQDYYRYRLITYNDKEQMKRLFHRLDCKEWSCTFIEHMIIFIVHPTHIHYCLILRDHYRSCRVSQNYTEEEWYCELKRLLYICFDIDLRIYESTYYIKKMQHLLDNDRLPLRRSKRIRNKTRSTVSVVEAVYDTVPIC